MPLLISIRVPGMTREQYDELSAAPKDQLKAAPSLHNHYAWRDEECISVVEIWARAAEHETGSTESSPRISPPVSKSRSTNSSAWSPRQRPGPGRPLHALKRLARP
jgi:hypothetical protein